MSIIDQSILDDLRDLDPSKIEKPTQRAAGLDGLPDGKYDIQIVSGDLKKLDDGKIVFNFSVKIIGGSNAGFVCQSDARWVKGEKGLNYDAINRIVSDLVTLGIPAGDWKGPGEFAANIASALTLVAGRKAKAQKVSKDSMGKTYHNLYINSLLPNDFKPSASAPAVMSFEQQSESDEGIPF